jgi:hypothetical protein
MKQSEFEEHVGKNNICANIEEALERAREVYDEMCAKLLAEPSHGPETSTVGRANRDHYNF